MTGEGENVASSTGRATGRGREASGVEGNSGLDSLAVAIDPFESASDASAFPDPSGIPAAALDPRADRRRFAVNAAAGGAANALKIGVQLVMLPLMARLLGPSEFGLFALALPTVNFFMTLADAGLGLSLAREDEASTAVWSTAFWILLAIGLFMSGAVAAFGFVLAGLSHEARLPGLMAALSVSFVLITSSVLPSARLTRRNRLVVLSATDLGSTLVGAALAVCVALAGGGAWSLVAQYVGGIAFRAAALNAAAFVMPTFALKPMLLRAHVSTGGAVLGGRLADFGGRLAENVLFGRAFGAAALGNYTLANQAPRFLCEAASGPVWGALYAHALGRDERSVADLFERLIRLLAVVVFPAAAVLSVSAPEVLGSVLGPKWSEAANMLQVLVLGYAVNAVASQGGALLLADGRGGALFWSYAGLSLGRVAAVGAGFLLGPLAVVWCVTAVNAVFAIYMLGAPARSDAASAARKLAAPLLASVAAAAACRLTLGLGEGDGAWTAAGLACAAIVYVAVLLAADRGHTLREFRALKMIVARNR